MGLFDRFRKKEIPVDNKIKENLALIDKLLSMDIKDIWNIEDSRLFVIAMNSWVCRKCGDGERMTALTKEERVFFVVMGLDAEVNNGGFDQYLYNSSGNFANELLPSLRTIGANQTADIFSRALNALGCELPSDRERRIDLLSELRTDEISTILDECDEQYYKYPDDIEVLCYQFIMKNKSRFV